KTFGQPPYKFLTNMRLDFAERLLVETDYTFSEVAFLSGFSSQSHLTSTLSRLRGMTPAKVRKSK
ncbi:helix-turn-helix domain-containing protein, partial [Nitratireductor sp. GCM10026969]|uniref:helix-turn-helix domain-containing protein n=1 Tax=Nitratireductor sp. GCM10026969 TaxID=3252645 RepID=UPI00362419D8